MPKCSIRRCISCRERVPKQSLLRAVWSVEGVVLDTQFRYQARGAYVHPRWECIQRLTDGKPFESALRLQKGTVTKDIVTKFRIAALEIVRAGT